MRSIVRGAISTRPALHSLMLVAILLLLVPLPACDTRAAPATSFAVGRRPPSFNEVYYYTDGLEVQVSKVSSGRRLGIPVVEFSVTISNHSEHNFEAWISGDLRYGRYRLPAVRHLTPPGPDDRGSVQPIAIGETSDPYQLCFVIPPGSRDDVLLHVAIDADVHDPAVFVGEL
jgi:hypothetical protein